MARRLSALALFGVLLVSLAVSETQAQVEPLTTGAEDNAGAQYADTTAATTGEESAADPPTAAAGPTFKPAPTPTNPCTIILCPRGTICSPDFESNKARCLSACAAVKCSAGYECKVNTRGEAGCVKTGPPASASCQTFKCKRSEFCTIGGGAPQCLSKCAVVRCGGSKPRCVTNLKGDPVCVRA